MAARSSRKVEESYRQLRTVEVMLAITAAGGDDDIDNDDGRGPAWAAGRACWICRSSCTARS